MLHTTFRKAKEAGACAESYKKFARHVGGIKKYGEDTPIPLIEILNILGLDDALWCLQCTVEDSDKFSRLLACDYAEHVLPIFEKAYPKDNRPRRAIEESRLYAEGKSTPEKMADAWSDAWSDARSAAWSAKIKWQEELFRIKLKETN